MKNLLLFSLGLILFGCNQERIIELENEINEKDSLIFELEQRVSQLEQYEPDLSIRNLSDEEVINLLKQYVDFTCPEFKFKEVQVRRSGDTQYVLSFLATNTSYAGNLWKRTIYSITFVSGDSFNVIFQKGLYCG